MSVFRFGWHKHLFGPFGVGGTIWRARRPSLLQGSRQRHRGPSYHGQIPELGWTCPHDHRRPDTAEACAAREIRRRGLVARQP